MNKKTIMIVGAVVVVVLIIAFFAMGNHGSTPQPQPTQTGANAQTQPTPTGPYSSPNDGFSANFSGTPVVTQSTFSSPSAGSIPVTKYVYQSGAGSSTGYYVINVYHYPTSYKFPSNYLSGALKLFVASVNTVYPGVTLTSQTPTTIQGSPAISGVLSIPLPVVGGKMPGYVLITTKGQNTYGVGTYGVDQASFNAFVNSFTFTQ